MGGGENITIFVIGMEIDCVIEHGILAQGIDIEMLRIKEISEEIQNMKETYDKKGNINKQMELLGLDERQGKIYGDDWRQKHNDDRFHQY